MPAGTLETIIICAASTVQASPCPAGMAPTVMTGYVASATSQTTLDLLVDNQVALNLLLTGGFDSATAELGFVGVLLIWAVGLGIGLIANLVRKAK